jgi:Zn-dependent protease
MMAIVGPLSSIVIALIFYGMYITGLGGIFSEPVVGVVGYLAYINGILAAFNLVPAFPLDGGRVLRSIIWAIKGNLRKATRISSGIGSGFGILLIVYGVFGILMGNFVSGMWWFLIGMFVQGAAKASYQQVVVRKALEGESLERFMKSEPVTVSPILPIDQLVEDYIYKFHFKMFPVVENGDQLVGCVTTKQIKEIPREEWPAKKVGDIAQQCTEENTIFYRTDAIEALSTMHRTGNSRLMVVDGNRLIGVIALKDMLEFLSLKMDLDVDSS